MTNKIKRIKKLQSISEAAEKEKRSVLYILQDGTDSGNLEAGKDIERGWGWGKSGEDVPVVIEKGSLVWIVKVDGRAFVTLERSVSREREDVGDGVRLRGWHGCSRAGRHTFHW